MPKYFIWRRKDGVIGWSDSRPDPATHRIIFQCQTKEVRDDVLARMRKYVNISKHDFSKRPKDPNGMA